MKIEHINKPYIQGLEKKQLHALRLRFLQVNDKWFDDPHWPDCTQAEFIEKYGMLVDEMKSRDMPIPTKSIDRHLFIKRITKTPEAPKERQSSDKIVKFIVQKDEDTEERIVMGIVYEPNEDDSQGDWANAEEIRKAAYSFMESGQLFKINHSENASGIRVLESFLAPTNYTIGEEDVSKGSWVMASRILDDTTWEGIKDGSYTGYSMAGEAIRIREPA